MNCIHLSVTLNVNYNILIYLLIFIYKNLSPKSHSLLIVYAETQNRAFHKEFLKKTLLLLFDK
jgi:hypothetical protein